MSYTHIIYSLSHYVYACVTVLLTSHVLTVGNICAIDFHCITKWRKYFSNEIFPFISLKTEKLIIHSNKCIIKHLTHSVAKKEQLKFDKVHNVLVLWCEMRWLFSLALLINRTKTEKIPVIVGTLPVTLASSLSISFAWSWKTLSS